MYVPKEFQVYTSQEMAAFISKLNDVCHTWSDLLTIDYFYHFQDSDYDEGLSFFDRLAKKIGKHHPDWDVAEYKQIVKTANDPQAVYVDIVKFMLDDTSDIIYYGI